MHVQNWPPSNAPTWPPAELGMTRLEFSDLRTALRDLQELGFTKSSPTSAEQVQFFTGVMCDEDHVVLQNRCMMLVSPLGVRYPFCVCNNAAHRQFLVLWGPDYCMGGRSGDE